MWVVINYCLPNFVLSAHEIRPPPPLHLMFFSTVIEHIKAILAARGTSNLSRGPPLCQIKKMRSRRKIGIREGRAACKDQS